MPPRAYGDVLQRRNAGRRLKMAAKYKLCVQRRVLSASAARRYLSPGAKSKNSSVKRCCFFTLERTVL